MLIFTTHVDLKLTVHEHHTVLCQILKDHATQWREIGMYLNFSPGALKNIQANPLLLQNAPKSWLYMMLEDFLKFKQSDDESDGPASGASLNLLKSALTKANLGATASQLKEHLLKGELVFLYTVVHACMNL